MDNLNIALDITSIVLNIAIIVELLLLMKSRKK